MPPYNKHHKSLRYRVNTKSIADEITQSLSTLGRGSRQGHRPSSQRDFGVYTPDLRKVVRAFRNRLASQTGDFVYEVALRLLDKKITECRQLIDDNEDMVQKAISWALRALVPWDRESVQAFLAEHSGSVSALVRREVMNKLRTGKKN